MWQQFSIRSQYLWDGFDITIYFKEDLSEEQQKELEGIIESWSAIGLWGGYKGLVHDVSPLWAEGRKAGFTVDMGSSEPIALEMLFNAISFFAKQSDLNVEKIVLGFEVIK